LEDVDVAGATQCQEIETEHRSQFEANQHAKLLQSVLLNALDGVASQEGQVLILTTNYIERLDGALVRPARVDRKISFGLADKNMIARLFCIFYEHSDDDFTNEGRQVQDGEIVEKLATEFVKKGRSWNLAWLKYCPFYWKIGNRLAWQSRMCSIGRPEPRRFSVRVCQTGITC